MYSIDLPVKDGKVDIKEPEKEGKLYYQNRYLKLEGFDNGKDLLVMDTSGRIVLKTFTAPEIRVNLKTGVYIIIADNRRFKIVIHH